MDRVIAGVAGLAAGALSAVVTTNVALDAGGFWFQYPPAQVGGYSDDMVRRWADTGHGLFPGATKEVLFYASAPPQGAILVPITDRVRTPIGNLQATDARGPTGKRAQFLVALRSLLNSNGWGDCDPRCVMLLIANESNWGHASWNRNPINAKSQGGVWARSVDEVVRTRQVYHTNYETNGIYLLTDNTVSRITGLVVGSLDGYPSYASWGQFFRRFKSLMERRYPGYLTGCRAGGLAGLVVAERALGGENPGGLKFSGASAASRESQARAYWANTAARVGAEFVR